MIASESSSMRIDPTNRSNRFTDAQFLLLGKFLSVLRIFVNDQITILNKSIDEAFELVTLLLHLLVDSFLTFSDFTFEFFRHDNIALAQGGRLI